MTADRPDRRVAPARGRPELSGPDRSRRRRAPQPARAGDTGPTRRLRDPGGSGRHAARERLAGPAPQPPPSPQAGPGGRAERREARRASGTPRPARLRWPDRLLRGLAGVLAGGMVVLALGILVVWVGADRYGLPGPGADVVVGHLVGAAVAVAGQRVADRCPDRTGTLAAGLVVALVAFVLGFAWFL